MPDTGGEMFDRGIGCHHCWPPDAEAAWAARTGLRREVELIDDPHLGIAVMVCPECGQRFASVFLEEVDWVDGDDPQYCSAMPLSADEAGLLLEPGAAVTEVLETLGAGRRSLRMDSPKGRPRRTYWGTGVLVR